MIVSGIGCFASINAFNSSAAVKISSIDTEEALSITSICTDVEQGAMFPYPAKLK